LDCIHEWKKKKDDLYFDRKMFSANISICLNCGKIKIEKVIKHPFSAVLQPKIGVFAGIFDKMGRILLTKVDSGQYKGEWSLPGGGVEAENSKDAIDERFLLFELLREIEEETGLQIPLNFNKCTVIWPTLLKGGYDLAIPILIGVVNDNPSKGEFIYASFKNVQNLANESPKKRLLDGSGKRMHRMVLRLLSHGPNETYQDQAQQILKSLY